MTVAYLITEYWYDALENRNFEGYSSVGIVLTKAEAQAIVAQGGMVPGDGKLIYPELPNGCADFSKQPTSGRVMNERYHFHELPLGALCTCNRWACKPSCKGTCGCKSCAAEYSDFLSGE